MAGTKHGRFANVKVTPTHFARIPLPKAKPKVEDKPIPDDERIIAPEITPPSRAKACNLLTRFEYEPRQTMDQEGREWFILSAVPGQERRLRLALLGLGFSAYLPTETLWVRLSKAHPRARREVQRPILHRYVFLGSRRGQDWGPLFARDAENRNAHGIVGILGFVNERKPAPVDVHWVASLARTERRGHYDQRKRQEIDPERPKVEAGELAEVIDGPFSGFEGAAVSTADSQGVRLSLKLFGRETLVLIPIEQVQNRSRIVPDRARTLRGPLLPEQKCA